MGDQSVRVLTDDEIPVATRLVERQMLGLMTNETAARWAELFRDQATVTHGSFAGKDLVGTASWFPTSLSYPGAPVDAAAVTAVAVLSNHRRQGHLTRLMEAELADAAAAGCAVAVLIAAEYPIYGRFGYGPATQSCSIHLDTGTAQMLADPTGSITLLDPAEARPGIQAAFEARWPRTPGAISRVDRYWDRAAGPEGFPDPPPEPAKQRAALWHDPDGTLGGAIRYSVEQRWTNNRPDAIAHVDHLWGATPEAERELWRHLLTVDWVRTAKASNRAVDDPLPFWLRDGRAATFVEHSDNLWLRILDLPAAFAARRTAAPGSFVVELDDPMGFVAGRWRIDVGPDSGEATRTTGDPDLRLAASTLGAALLGGHTLDRLGRAGLVEEHRAGAICRASASLHTATAPWSPLGF